MKLQYPILSFLLFAVNAALLLVFCGVVAHLAWYALSLGWGLVP